MCMETLPLYCVILQLVKELDRILEQPGAAEKARVKWLEIVPKVLEQARLESHKPYVDTALKQVADIEGEYSIINMCDCCKLA